MQLNDLEPAWRQFKLLNSMYNVESNEVLSIIEEAEKTNKSKLQRFLLNMTMLAVLTIICQGG